MARQDQLVGVVLLVIAVVVFAYYTTWTMVLPFMPQGHALYAFFPPRQFAILIPIALLVSALALVITFITYTVLKASRKKKEKETAKQKST